MLLLCKSNESCAQNNILSQIVYLITSYFQNSFYNGRTQQQPDEYYI